jgi:hypothetical protein
MSPNLQKTVFMMQTELTKKTVAQVGEAIPHELGALMIKDFQAANPSDVKSFRVGKNIIEKILSQPGCAGLRFYNAYNELGQKTLVYTGVDEFGKSLIEYTFINSDGAFESGRAIVADRLPNNDTDSGVEWWSLLTNMSK